MTQPRPTVFISYASEDRAAAILLRDALAVQGLDVWYDENELGGGDAWDQKIRRQIRECDYFMPVISATTERRKEGYFRREWRLAAERTLDMADDVMFLLPVTIDDTSEAGARVPEKFVLVQWLRVPGGTTTPALEVLARRLAAGDHSLPPQREAQPPLLRHARPATTPPQGKPVPDEPAHDGPPPMPPFPHMRENAHFSHAVKFFAEVIWWGITAGWLLLKRAPRWIRVVISIWFCVWLFSRCGRGSRDRDDDPAQGAKPTAAEQAEVRQTIQHTAEQLAAPGKPADGGPPNAVSKLADIGTHIARTIAAEMKDADQTDKEIVVVPFALGVTNADDAKFLSAVFTPLYGQLAVARAGETGVVSQPLPAVSAEDLVALGRRFQAQHVLGAQLSSADGVATLVVRLMKIEDASLAWTAQYPVAGSEPVAVADQIARGVLAELDK